MATGSCTAGSCLCGAIRFEVDGPFSNLMHCHCSMCRKHHGTAFASFVGAPATGFRWLAGKERIARYFSSPGNDRAFCPDCGSKVPTAMGDQMFMSAGTLEGELGDAGGMHIFAGSKAPWHEITDTLPRFDTVPPGWPLSGIERPAAPVHDDGVHGSCLCGEVRFRVTGAPEVMRNCHCSRCRRARSAAHATNCFYPSAQFSWLAGKTQVRKYKVPEAERFTTAFCAACGGEAPVERDGVPAVVVPAGLLDGDPGARPGAHIFVGSMARWYRITDAIPRFEGMSN